MIHKGTVILETKRLILRKFKIEDAQNMFDNWASNPNVTKYLTWGPHENIEITKLVINGWLKGYEEDNYYQWAIELKEIGEVIGAIDVIRKNPQKYRVELGWVIGDEFWGRGIMPEAAKEVLKYLFNEGYKRIEAIHDVRNAKSGRVMEKIGMKHEGRLAKYEVNRDGVLVDCEMYAITQD